MPGGVKGKRGPRGDGRRFVNALIWLARSGVRWRDLPLRFGNYQTVERRYDRWIARGVLDDLFAVLAKDADFEWLMLDTTVIRAHQQAAGACKQKGGLMPKGLAARAAA